MGLISGMPDEQHERNYQPPPPWYAALCFVAVLGYIYLNYPLEMGRSLFIPTDLGLWALVITLSLGAGIAGRIWDRWSAKD